MVPNVAPMMMRTVVRLRRARRRYRYGRNAHNKGDQEAFHDGLRFRCRHSAGIKRDSHYITNMWANIANPNRRHNMHMHPNCLLSGIFYIKTPKNCGPTAFASPRLISKNLEPTYLKKNQLNSDVFVIPAEKGRMLIWPSHVPHAVEQGAANEAEERIVVAFNIMIRGLIDLPTAAWS